MASKAADIQAQLERAQGRNAPASTIPASGIEAAKAKKAAGGREGKVHIGAYLDPNFRKSLRMVQAQTDRDFHQLVAEALNDLFRKYNVPVID